MNLLAMIDEKSKIATEIEERLDVELIEQQLQHKAFDVSNCVSWILSKMLQLCAPFRDASIREIGHLTEDPVAQFERIMEMLDHMKLDLANFRLQSLKPVLKEQAVEYEQRKFRELLESKQISLDNTTKWLKEKAMEMEKVAAQRNPENIQIPENRVKFEDIFYDAYLSLIGSAEPIHPSTCPETFMLDAQRIFGFQNQVQQLTIVSALLMLMKNAIPEMRDDHNAKKLKDTLLVLLKEKDITLDHLTTQLISVLQKSREGSMNSPTSPSTSSSLNTTFSFNPHRKPLTSEELEQQGNMIKAMVSKTLSSKDPVYQLLQRRLLATIKQHLVTGTFRKDNLNSTGLHHVANELEGLSVKICLLGVHNKKVYGEWYDGVLRNNH